MWRNQKVYWYWAVVSKTLPRGVSTLDINIPKNEEKKLRGPDDTLFKVGVYLLVCSALCIFLKWNHSHQYLDPMCHGPCRATGYWFTPSVTWSVKGVNCGVAGPPFIYCGGMSSSKLDRPKKLLPAFSPWATAASCRLSAAGQCQPETAVRGIWVTAEISEEHAVVYSVSWKYALLLQARKGWTC